MQLCHMYHLQQTYILARQIKNVQKKKGFIIVFSWWKIQTEISAAFLIPSTERIHTL